MKILKILAILSALLVPAVAEKEGAVQCANVIYAGNKTSRCFSDAFLTTLQQKTTIVAERRFKPVKLDSRELFDFPFLVMTGEGDFRLLQAERTNLAQYLQGGGFLLASSGCSDPAWTRSFRSEMGQIFPKEKLAAIPAVLRWCPLASAYPFARIHWPPTPPIRTLGLVMGSNVSVSGGR